MISRKRYFVVPPASAYSAGLLDAPYAPYAIYNYLRPGPIASFKRSRFETALRLASPLFHAGGAIDFGCADGVFLPSLSRHFDRVVGVDVNRDLIDASERLVRTLGLTNVALICNRGESPAGVRERLGDSPFRVAFLLETLEHVGQRGSLYEPKIELLRDVFGLLTHDGRVIASVPKMVGVPFLLKYLVQSTLRMHRERHSVGELLRSSFLKDTDALEARWDHGHIGFNHLKLERLLEREFRVVARRDRLFSVFYVLERAPRGA